MPKTPKFTAGHFRPESTAVKTLNGSTISSGEREVFARIFDEMLTQPITDAPKRPRFIQSRRTSEPLENVPKMGRKLSFSASFHDESLFLTPQEVEEYPLALRPLAAEFSREHVVPKDQELRNWEKRLDSCSTDFELANFLDSEVFHVMEAHAQGLPPEAGKTSFTSLRTNYSSILLKAMRLFRLLYHNPLAAHTLFLRAKMLSAESYVLGCTTKLYNELLLSRWESFTDLFSISEILDEMNTNGVAGDRDTADILQRIQSDVQEWATCGVEAVRPIWLAEKERMAKLERIQRETLMKIEKKVEIPLHEVAGMEHDLEKEVLLPEEVAEMEYEPGTEK